MTAAINFIQNCFYFQMRSQKHAVKIDYFVLIKVKMFGYIKNTKRINYK